MAMALLHIFTLVHLFTALLRTHAYIPALPTNSTQSAIDGGLNVTDVSKIRLQWYSNGSYAENVSYQLVGNNSNGISQGALVHFSEDIAGPNQTTPTPWIALIACDANGTTFSLIDDIFTLARDRGAVSALLYSMYSNACIINPEYASPDNFDQVFDIFSTQSLTSAQLIEYQFGRAGASNESIYGPYNPKRLGGSEQDIKATIETGAPVAPGYLFATLQAYNATGTLGGDMTGASDDNRGTPPSGQNGSSTGLAMIILYAITGCVSALFILVIISGAIRAIRHPERYGPRAGVEGGGTGPGQSRARGITRAILDTFPVVKFGGSPDDSNVAGSPPKDLEASSRPATLGTEMDGWVVADGPSSPGPSSPSSLSPKGYTIQDGVVEEDIDQRNLKVDFSPTPRPARDTAASSSPRKEDVVPDSIGRETCPICIVDFEEGDNLRVLPCEGKHRFHQTCVDPWLLELSSSCPICRQDFLALENIISGGSEDAHQHRASYYHMHNRFSRYLKFARRHNQREDPTDPYMATAPETSM